MFKSFHRSLKRGGGEGENGGGEGWEGERGEGWKQGEETVQSTIFWGADLKGNGSEDSGRPENTENVQIF